MKKEGKSIITIILVLIMFSISAFLFSADDSIEELEKKLGTVFGKEKIEVLNQLSAAYLNHSPEKSIDWGNKALQLARELRHRKGEAMALKNIGSGNVALARYEKALEYFNHSLRIFETIKSNKDIGECFYFIGRTYFYLSDYDKALEHFLKSYETRKKTGDNKDINLSLNSLGVLYGQLNNYKKALEYFLESLEINEKIGNKKGIAYSLGNIGILYRRLEKYDRAIKYLLESLKMEEEIGNKRGIAKTLHNIGNVFNDKSDYIKALEYQQKSLKIKEELHDKSGIASSLNSIGEVNINLGNYKKALDYSIESLKITGEIGDKEGAAIALNRIGMIHIKMKKYASAQENLEEGLKIAKQRNIKTLVMYLYQNLSHLFSAKGDYKKALEYFKLLAKVKDEIMNKESNDKIAELQTKYETVKKEKEIALLEKNNEILKKDNKIKAITRNALIAAFILVLIIAMLLFKKYLHLFAFWKKKNYIGHYRILDQIGSGGMGVVYKAAHVMENSKSVAVKVIREEYSNDPIRRKRFMNEALMVDQLNHPNIVKVYERGEYDQKLFIAMEFLAGQSLAEIIKKEEQIPIKDCLQIMNQLVKTLVKVHSKGIIHRDLKPENIILIEKEEVKYFVKLLDFGLAKHQTLTRLTETGEILGTINYLPPERISRQEFSTASDIYSLGVVFYEMLTFEKPFIGEAPVDIIKQILEKEPIEPNQFRPEIPKELSDLILKMMSKEPGKRPREERLLKIIENYILPAVQ